MSNSYDYKRLCPFKWFVLENFPFIEADFDALTNWQLFCKLGKEMNKIINSTNSLGVQVENLTDYFNNLDVQEEINNKLDDMAESGELENIISAYLNVNGVLSFNTKADMITSTSLVEGSTCRTLGNTTYNDGLGRLYKIEHIVSASGVDGVNLINLNRDDLYARLITEQYLTDISNLQSNVGTLSNLETNNKSNLVNAINEIVNHLKEGNNTYPAGTTFHILAGSIRQDETDPTQWAWISDSAHQPIGFTNEVTLDSQYYVKVNFDQNYDKVVTFLATPDNYLASNAELSIGASVGTNNALISAGTNHRIDGTIYYDGTDWVDSNGGTVSFSNGIITLVPNSNLITYGNYAFRIRPMSRGYNTMKVPVQLETGLRVKFFNPDGTTATTPSTDMNIFYEIGGNSRAVRMNQPLGASSNIWLIGIMAKYPET